jgi:hypothetical protein
MRDGKTTLHYAGVNSISPVRDNEFGCYGSLAGGLWYMGRQSSLIPTFKVANWVTERKTYSSFVTKRELEESLVIKR